MLDQCSSGCWLGLLVVRVFVTGGARAENAPHRRERAAMKGGEESWML